VWSIPGDFATIQDAIDDASVNDGDAIVVGPEQARLLMYKEEDF
jgi:hypothetical protein